MDLYRREPHPHHWNVKCRQYQRGSRIVSHRIHVSALHTCACLGTSTLRRRILECWCGVLNIDCGWLRNKKTSVKCKHTKQRARSAMNTPPSPAPSMDTHNVCSRSLSIGCNNKASSSGKGGYPRKKPRLSQLSVILVGSTQQRHSCIPGTTHKVSPKTRRLGWCILRPKISTPMRSIPNKGRAHLVQ